MKKLNGKKIAILATNGFEQSELLEPKRAIEEAGGTTEVISLKKGKIRSWKDGDWGKEIDVDKDLSEADAKQYQGLLLPGGVINPDLLRKDKKAVQFVQSFVSDEQQKPIAAICHGPWMLVEAGMVKGKKMTSYASIKTDLVNAGANWVDEEVVVDNGIVTSRSPKDLNAFINKEKPNFKGE